MASPSACGEKHMAIFGLAELALLTSEESIHCVDGFFSFSPSGTGCPLADVAEALYECLS